MSRVARFDKNTKGRDFVVGDIHGCFDKLETELRKLNFDEFKDRLFSVGDLVDRGPDSEASLKWLSYPWFHAVRGNHEQMAIGVAAGKHDLDNYRINGGAWFIDKDFEERLKYASAFSKLPYAIDVQTDAGLVGIVHAECAGNSWEDFCFFLDNPPSNNYLRMLTEVALWERNRITSKTQDEVQGIVHLYVGHTPLKEPLTLGNVTYVDTGCFYTGNITVMQIQP